MREGAQLMSYADSAGRPRRQAPRRAVAIAIARSRSRAELLPRAVGAGVALWGIVELALQLANRLAH